VKKITGFRMKPEDEDRVFFVKMIAIPRKAYKTGAFGPGRRMI
jgi:hypothetical protein